MQIALIIPDDPLYHQTGSAAEIKVFQSLKALPDEWTVIHSLRWVRSNPATGAKPQGEGDFICLHPDYGAIVLEVKGGGISYRNGRWFSESFSGEVHPIQDPEKQASDTKFETIERLRRKSIRSCYVSHCVWFPDVTVASIDLPMNLSEAIVLDSHSLQNPLDRLVKVVQFWRERNNASRHRIPDTEYEQVKRLLNPSFRLVKTQKAWANEINDTYVKLNDKQIEIVEATDCRELSISGRAGTGKTIVGLHLGRKAAQEGKRVLFLCFNRELATRLARENESPMEIRTIHSFALSYLQRHYPHRVLDFDDSSGFDYLMDQFKTVAPKTTLHYDVLIVDEAQDFRVEWVKAIKYFRHADSRLLILYDSYQQLWTSSSEPDTHYLRLPTHMELRRNMRNTDQISKACLRIIGADAKAHKYSGVSGREPEVIVTERAHMEGVVLSTIHTLRQVDQIPTESITVVTLDTEGASLLGSSMKDPNMPEFFSVRRFKGLENDVVIVVDVELSTLEDPVKSRLLYVALSRARVNAYVFVSIDPLYRQYFLNKYQCSPNQVESVVKRIIRGGT